MIHNLSIQPSIINEFVAELRDETIQKDRMRFRRNLERVGEIMAYEISKTLDYASEDVQSSLGVAEMERFQDDVVITTILRAGLPLHQGLLNYFDHAGNAFVASYRQHHKDGSFNISMEYCTTPDLDDKVVILSDVMIASGASIENAIERLMQNGKPKKIHVVGVVAVEESIERLKRLYPKIDIWVAAVDTELTAKSYIVPGLGDAGDLAFGSKLTE